MYKKILVAYDRSAQARAALASAVEMIDCGMAERIMLLSVMENHEDDPTFEIAARMAGLIDEGAAVYDKAPAIELEESVVELINNHENVIETLVMRGKPADVIVSTARDNGCDLIIMGRRGVSALQSVLGSVSTAVLRNSDLPVLVTK